MVRHTSDNHVEGPAKKQRRELGINSAGKALLFVSIELLPLHNDDTPPTCTDLSH